ncbi:hypothetical protein J14TS5_31440 [Paenibacillus lautus]|nr:hypothetical protein J14TS5_31440 [Paenibacillus lautus]
MRMNSYSFEGDYGRYAEITMLHERSFYSRKGDLTQNEYH